MLETRNLRINKESATPTPPPLTVSLIHLALTARGVHAAANLSEVPKCLSYHVSSKRASMNILPCVVLVAGPCKSAKIHELCMQLEHIDPRTMCFIAPHRLILQSYSDHKFAL